MARMFKPEPEGRGSFKPTLAAEAPGDLSTLPFPMLASFKLDGIRCIITEDGPRTRSLKPFPNAHTQRLLSELPVGLDGEVCVLDAAGKVDFRETTGDVRREAGEPDIRFYVFDDFTNPAPFADRYTDLQHMDDEGGFPDWCFALEQREVNSAEEIDAMFADALEQGFEGLILRRLDSPYKQGRSGKKEAFMLKVKPWADAEGKVVAIIPEYHNGNEAKKNALGRTERSSCKEGKVQKESMGALVVVNPKWPKPFEIGTGFSKEDRAEIWKQRDEILAAGELAKFKYVTVGGYDVPRHCVFLGFRMKEDT